MYSRTWAAKTQKNWCSSISGRKWHWTKRVHGNDILMIKTNEYEQKKATETWWFDLLQEFLTLKWLQLWLLIHYIVARLRTFEKCISYFNNRYAHNAHWGMLGIVWLTVNPWCYVWPFYINVLSAPYLDVLLSCAFFRSSLVIRIIII
jgi:hypothetical protein